MTEKLYDKDPYQKTFTATVLSCVSAGEGYEVVLDRTAFFPEGGGQYGDRGSLDGVPVTDTQIREETVYHRTDRPFAVGSTVTGTLDWGERFRRMRNHSGEHILSGIVCRRFGCDNVGFHLGDREMTVDYNCVLTGEDLLSVEFEANTVIENNLPILCGYPSKEELSRLNYRSKKEIDGPVRIVAVGDVDVCACCAPHVRTTGEVDSLYIVSSMAWKGGTRLTVRCGSDAFDEYRTLRRDEDALARLFSAPRGEVFPAAEKLYRQYNDLRRNYAQALRENALLQVGALPGGEGNFCLFLADAEADALRSAANEGVKKYTGLFAALSADGAGGYRYVIASPVAGLREKAREINLALSGKGGGSDTMIQGSFSAGETQIREFFKEFQI